MNTIHTCNTLPTLYRSAVELDIDLPDIEVSMDDDAVEL